MKADTFDSGILGRRQSVSQGERRRRRKPRKTCSLVEDQAEATGATGAGSRISSTEGYIYCRPLVGTFQVLASDHHEYFEAKKSYCR